MRLGIFGARGDSRGLHYQTQGFAKWLAPDRVFGVDLTADGGSPYPCDWSAYEGTDLQVQRHSALTQGHIAAFLTGLDVVLGAETFYHDAFLSIARHLGVRTVLQVNPEFVPAGRRERPDLCLNPSTWRSSYLPWAVHLPFPVDREVFAFRRRTVARHFVHVAGHAAIADRAGTNSVVTACEGMHDVTIRTQSPLQVQTDVPVQTGFDDPRGLYADADVVVIPRRFGGQSLVANEALSSGCPLVVIDRTPDRDWGGTYPVAGRVATTLATPAGRIDVHDADVQALRRAIDTLREDPSLVCALSEEADAYAQAISWDSLLPRYMDVLAC
jgi:hypothetical protein